MRIGGEDNVLEPGSASGVVGYPEESAETLLYTPDYSVNQEGDIVTHDARLNKDAAALHQFLQSQVAIPPKFVVRCHGTHTQTRKHVIRSGNSRDKKHEDENGERPPEYTTTSTKNIIDFDFKVDISSYLMSPVHWTVADDEPAYRGGIFSETGDSTHHRQSTWTEIWKASKQRSLKAQNGQPPWVQNGHLGESHRAANTKTTCSTLTLREWINDYCTSSKTLKELQFDKSIYGWNLSSLQSSIETLIKSTGYTGKLNVSFSTTGNKVYIRPEGNRFLRAVGSTCIEVLLCLAFVYPFVWIFRYWGGAAVWRVAGVAYPLKEWVHLEDSIAGEDVAQYRARRPANAKTPDVARLRKSLRGISELVGVREEEWFEQWEGVLRRAVVLGLQRDVPIQYPSEVVSRHSGVVFHYFPD
ncbi:hypothetical protein M408DRAFT_67255 [Serendipita vermifera MAFF 305830]|uniref:Uncharacterized protein n=1 Tax=Serendipita vermifera MAFF 305830 TaxID=933852 RepID=A0A0C3BEH4_SERVB|nr:hypothetical protein M408DRAFT_67255 [Serendipita vermifera MAFF 305830]